MNANFRKYYLNLYPITKFGIIDHVLSLIAHVLASLLLTHNTYAFAIHAYGNTLPYTKPDIIIITTTTTTFPPKTTDYASHNSSLITIHLIRQVCYPTTAPQEDFG